MSIDLTRHCDLYSASIRKSILSLGQFDIGEFKPSSSQSMIEMEKSSLIFSVPILGPIYGEFLFMISKEMGLEVMGFSYTPKTVNQEFEKRREIIIEFFKEVVNIAAGKPLAELINVFPNLSLSSPRVIEGLMQFPPINFYKSCLSQSNNVQCFLYVDQSKTDISIRLEDANLTIEKDHLLQEELKRLNHAKSNFLANMSHELRTPLNGIIGMVDLIKDTSLTNSQRDQLDIIYQSGEFLLSIINDILDFSKIEDGKLKLEGRAFDLRKAVETVVSSFVQAAEKKGLDFYVFIDPNIAGNVFGDEVRLKQVISNLVGNAVKFTASGYIELLVTKKNDHVHISVKDTGVGIPVDKHKAIFESFTQADTSDTRKYGGSGLGLSISKSIVEAMGGQLSLISKEQEGAIFSFMFPCSIELRPPLTHLNTKKILVVGENKKNSDILKSYLHHLGCEVDFIHSIGELLEKENDYDYVLLNYAYYRNTERQYRRQFLKKSKSGKIKYIFVGPRKQLLKTSDQYRKFNIQCLSYPLVLSFLIKLINLDKDSEQINVRKIDGIKELKVEKKGISRIKILLVEDNALNQLVAKTMLEKLGYDVAVAENGQMALKSVVENEYSLVLMDCQMSVMDGFHATKEIRNLTDEKKSQIPVVAVTANAFLETKERCLDAGMNYFLTKPFHQNQLQQVVQKALRLPISLESYGTRRKKFS